MKCIDALGKLIDVTISKPIDVIAEQLDVFGVLLEDEEGE